MSTVQRNFPHDLEDTAGHPLSNGWSNPRSILDVHPGISGVALDGSIGDDFNLAVTILPGDSNHDNNEVGFALDTWPVAHVTAVYVSDHTDTDFGNAHLASTGNGTQLVRVPIFDADKVWIRFNQPMPVTGLHGLSTTGLILQRTDSLGGATATVAAGSFEWDAATFTAGWRLDTDTSPSTAPNILGKFHLKLSELLFDASGRALDGEWTNPVNLNPTSTASSHSGNGTAGGQFDFVLIFFPMDINGDNIAGFIELGIILNNYDLPGGWINGDLNGDGAVDFVDLGILLNIYNQSL